MGREKLRELAGVAKTIRGLDWTVRRLAMFSDGLGKVRYIAISDWLTQMCLSLIHRCLFSNLKKIKEDFTYRQDEAQLVIRKWFQSGVREVYSLDLTAATDRLPLDLQVHVLRQYGFRKELLDAWKFLMVGIPYSVRGGSVSYSVGQGMGSYSS